MNFVDLVSQVQQLKRPNSQHHCYQGQAEKFSEDLRIIEKAVLDRFLTTIKAVENMDEKIAGELIGSYRNDLGKLSDKIVASSISGHVEWVAGSCQYCFCKFRPHSFYCS